MHSLRKDARMMGASAEGVDANRTVPRAGQSRHKLRCTNGESGAYHVTTLTLDHHHCSVFNVHSLGEGFHYGHSDTYILSVPLEQGKAFATRNKLSAGSPSRGSRIMKLMPGLSHVIRQQSEVVKLTAVYSTQAKESHFESLRSRATGRGSVLCIRGALTVER